MCFVCIDVALTALYTNYMSSNNIEAADSSLGFYFQSAYSLILLSRASDNAAVSVETVDDLKLSDHGAQTLGQLKHSIGTPPEFNEKNDGFWKTIKNWISVDEWDKYQFMFVTCAKLSTVSKLACLSETDPERNISSALNCLRLEAERVLATPTVAEAESLEGATGYDYKVRRPACQAFMGLSDSKQERLVRKLTLVTSSFNAGDVEAELQNELLNSEPQRHRAIIAERLIEWWDRRIARALLKKSPREVQKTELLEHLSELRIELSGDNLPNDFGHKRPDDFSSELGGNMQKQIELVDGGLVRVNKAARERWRARNQRDRWMADSLAFADDLGEYDEMLIEEWNDRHGVMKHDTDNLEEEEQKRQGLELLDWSHNRAHLELMPFKDGIGLSFLVRGSYQQLAEELLVGWHPDYEELCQEVESGMRWHDDDEC